MASSALAVIMPLLAEPSGISLAARLPQFSLLPLLSPWKARQVPAVASMPRPERVRKDLRFISRSPSVTPVVAGGLECGDLSPLWYVCFRRGQASVNPNQTESGDRSPHSKPLAPGDAQSPFFRDCSAMVR